MTNNWTTFLLTAFSATCIGITIAFLMALVTFTYHAEIRHYLL